MVKPLKARILVVDDELSARGALAELLRDERYDVRGAGDGFKALAQIEDWAPDLLVTDVQMPGISGLELMERVKEQYPAVGVVMMTAFSSVEKAVDAMRRGADDYLTKPIHVDELLIVIDRILDHHSTVRENERLRAMLAIGGDDVGWVGQSRASRDVVQLLRQVADSGASVLLFGESGTGKELAARALHQWSSRRSHPFVGVHCASLAEGVLESELFGHEKGAFTGAVSRREGRFERARGGTLFLDEVSEIPLSTQVKLLRVLQERELERVGGDETIDVEVRVIAATHRDLTAEVAEGRFREDLYYRLNVIAVRLPTLSERHEDIPLLATHFLRRHAVRNRKDIRGFSDRALQTLSRFGWPGNIRQLENCIERAVVLCGDYEIEPRHLPQDVLGGHRTASDIPSIPGSTMAEIEKYAILKTLEQLGGSTSRASKALGISPRTIQYRLNEYRECDPSGVAALVGRRGGPPPGS